MTWLHFRPFFGLSLTGINDENIGGCAVLRRKSCMLKDIQGGFPIISSGGVIHALIQFSVLLLRGLCVLGSEKFIGVPIVIVVRIFVYLSTRVFYHC